MFFLHLCLIGYASLVGLMSRQRLLLSDRSTLHAVAQTELQQPDKLYLMHR